MTLCPNENVIFVKTRSDGYGNTKIVVDQDCVPCIFLQGTGFIRNNRQENVDADAVCFPQVGHRFLVKYKYRLEGMFILAPLFGIDDDDGWYLVTGLTVNRDHLLTNEIENVELLLKKTRPPYGFS